MCVCLRSDAHYLTASWILERTTTSSNEAGPSQVTAARSLPGAVGSVEFLLIQLSFSRVSYFFSSISFPRHV